MAGKYFTAVSWCFLCMSVFLFAQTESDKHYYIRQDEEGAVLYQQLSWEYFEDILGYEFELEQKNDAGEWIPLEKKTSEENFVEVSLSPGSYRFRVSLINLLEQTEALSDYQNFSVLLARQPAVYEVSPKLIYFDSLFDRRLSVKGKNFFPETQFSLESSLGVSLELTPVEIDTDGSYAVFELKMDLLFPGNYVFCARDKSGLYDNRQSIEFKFQKPLDVYVSAGYAFTGFTGKNVFTEYYERDFAPLGGIVRFALIPFKRAYGNFGFNVNYSAFLMDKTFENYKMSGYVMMPQIHAVYVYPLIKNRLNLDVHVGTGAVFLMNSRFVFSNSDFKSPVYWYWGMSVNGGTALQVYVWKKLYLELNVDHIVSLRKGFPLYMYQPGFSVGWEF